MSRMVKKLIAPTDDLHRIEREIITVRRSIRFGKKNSRPVHEAQSALRRLITKAKRLRAERPLRSKAGASHDR